jgi:WhiB family transcriptional regulator, redox-sensing transcriptional regulator
MTSRAKLTNFSIPNFVLSGKPSCADVDPELFFPQEIEVTKTKTIGKYVNLKAARQICSTCPLKVACLDYGLRNHEIGIWGGLTETQRDDLRKTNRIKLTRKSATPELW